jgi:type 1 glutamine amidotransferase
MKIARWSGIKPVAFVFAWALSMLPAEAAAAAATAAKPHVVFLISEDPDNYEAHRTIPVFAETLRKDTGFEVTVIKGEGERTAFRFPRLVEILPRADLVVVFARRLALPAEQMNALKGHLKNGKPLVGIRTANHAFTPREKIAEGYVAWPEFVADVLGCENRGYGAARFGTDVAATKEAAGHPILRGVPAQWHSKGNVYHVAPLLDSRATVLLTGTIPDKTEPIAWTRTAAEGSRVFYTSLGYPADFDTAEVPTLLTNGIRWALNRAN